MSDGIELSLRGRAGSSTADSGLIAIVGSHFFGSMREQATWAIGTFGLLRPILAHFCFVAHGVQRLALLVDVLVLVFFPLDPLGLGTLFALAA